MNQPSSDLGTRIHRYPGYLRIFSLLFNILAFVYPPYLAIRTLSRAMASGAQIHPLAVVMIVLLAASLCLVLLLTANFFPEVHASHSAIQVRFLWHTLTVRPAELTALKPVPTLPGMKPSSWVVATTALTPFHRLYGFVYGFWSHPSFMIYGLISERDDLLRTMEDWLHRRAEQVTPPPA
jgi:hypothetical protein